MKCASGFGFGFAGAPSGGPPPNRAPHRTPGRTGVPPGPASAPPIPGSDQLLVVTEDADDYQVVVAVSREEVEDSTDAEFVVDATVGATATDEAVVRLLRTTKKPVFLVANKVDDARQEPEAAALWNLGLGQPWPVSALHGRGSGDALDAVLDHPGLLRAVFGGELLGHGGLAHGVAAVFHHDDGVPIMLEPREGIR